MSRAKCFLNRSYKQNTYFWLFFAVVNANMDAFFATLYPPPKGGGKLVFGGYLGDPLQARH